MQSRAIETITVEVHTLADLEAAMKSFKITCRPRRSGRPSYLGERVFVLAHLSGTTVRVSLRIGESCLGAGGWGMTARLADLDTGRRTTIQKIAQRIVAAR